MVGVPVAPERRPAAKGAVTTTDVTASFAVLFVQNLTGGIGGFAHICFYAERSANYPAGHTHRRSAPVVFLLRNSYNL